MTTDASTETHKEQAHALRKRAERVYEEFFSQTDENGRSVCPCLQNCLGSRSLGEHSINSDLALRIGDRYGEDMIVPKVLFIGKESVVCHNKVGKTSSSPSDNNPHYRCTLLTIAYLIEALHGDDTKIAALNAAVEKHDPDGITIDRLLRDYSDSFALTNFYKCAFKGSAKRSGIKNTAAQNKNCVGLLLKEIECIRPRIMIKQTTAGSRQFEEALQSIAEKDPGARFCGKPLYEAQGNRISAYKYALRPSAGSARVFPDTFYVVYTYHPCARGEYSFNRSWECLKKAIDSILKDLPKDA